MDSIINIRSYFENIRSSDELKNSASAIGVWVEERPILLYTGFGVIIVVGLGKLFGIRQRFFAWLNSACVKKKDSNYEAFKIQLFEPLSTIESHIPQLREKKTLKILEVGVGSGVNFTYYPKETELIVIDPNPYFEKYYYENLQKFPHINAKQIIVATGEDMSMVEDASVDIVVMTSVLCSVQDVTEVVREVYRVLVPGGRYFFMDHVKEWDEKYAWRRSLQFWLTRLGIWPFLFDGCMLDRNPLRAIEGAGFSGVSHKYFYAPMPFKYLNIVSPHLQGIATK